MGQPAQVMDIEAAPAAAKVRAVWANVYAYSFALRCGTESKPDYGHARKAARADADAAIVGL